MDSILLNKIKRLPYGHRFFTDPQPAYLKNLAIPNCGHSIVNSSRYYWDLNKRNPNESIFQYTIRGTGRLHIDGENYITSPEEAMILTTPSNVQYYFQEGNEPWHFIFITLQGSTFYTPWNHIIEQHGPLVHIESGDPLIHHAIYTIQQAYEGALDSPTRIAHAAASFGLALIEHMEEHSVAINIPAPIQRAIRYCEENLRKPLSLDILADVAGCSTWHFAREFKKHKGIAPGGYIEKRRIEQAAELLKYTQKTVSDIAAECGYSTPNYFARAFRKVMHDSPAAFRNNYSLK